MLDEIGEGAEFLATPLTNDRDTELLERYLREVWACLSRGSARRQATGADGGCSRIQLLLLSAGFPL